MFKYIVRVLSLAMNNSIIIQFKWNYPVIILLFLLPLFIMWHFLIHIASFETSQQTIEFFFKYWFKKLKLIPNENKSWKCGPQGTDIFFGIISFLKGSLTILQNNFQESSSPRPIHLCSKLCFKNVWPSVCKCEMRLYNGYASDI